MALKLELLELRSLPNETAETISDYLMESLSELKLLKKCIAFSGDNCNTNFGGLKRAGKKNVNTHLKNLMNKNIFGIGCPVHIAHNAAKHGIDTLMFDTESISLKIYNHFSIYTVRTEALKEFCQFVDIEYRNLLYHSATRWLSLYPAVNRILQMFPALKSYFLSIDTCPMILKTFFEGRLSEAYLYLYIQ